MELELKSLYFLTTSVFRFEIIPFLTFRIIKGSFHFIFNGLFSFCPSLRPSSTSCFMLHPHPVH